MHQSIERHPVSSHPTALPWLRGAMLLLAGLLLGACGGGGGGGGAGNGGGSGGGGTANSAPVISGTPATMVLQGNAYSFTPSASDADGDTLTFSISGQPAWTSFDAASGTLSGTPAATDVGEAGPIEISVSDGTASNSLSAFSITVPPYALLSDEPGSAEIEDSQFSAAFMANGDGVAVWVVDTESDYVLRYATYSAASGTWSPDAELASFSQNDYLRLEAAAADAAVGIVYTAGDRRLFSATYAGGVMGTPRLLDELSDVETSALLYINDAGISASATGFAASWLRGSSYDPVTRDREYEYKVRLLAAPGAAWSEAATLNSPGNVYSRADIVSNGSTFLAFWSEGDWTQRDVFVNYFNGISWLGTPLSLGASAGTGNLAVASNGDGYQLAWVADDRQTLLGTHFSSSFVQSPTATLAAAGTNTLQPKITSNGTDYLVTYARNNEIVVTMGADAAWSTAEALVGSDSYYNGSIIAGRGNSYAAVWQQANETWASVYNGSNWTTPAAISENGQSPSEPHIATTDTGYAVTWTQRPDGTSGPVDLASAQHDGTSWSTAAIIDTQDDDVEWSHVLAPAGTDVAALWVQNLDDDSGQAVFAARSDSAFATATNIATSTTGASVRPTLVISNDAGQSLAVWNQARGAVEVTYASVRDADGTWGTPFIVNEGVGYYGYVNPAAVTTNGSGFAYAISTGGDDSDRGDVYVNVFDGSAWSGLTQVDTGLNGSVQTAVMTSNGSGYAVAWAQLPTADWSASEQTVYASVYEASAWSQPVVIDPAGDGQSPSLASNGSGYAITWDQYGYPRNIAINLYDGSAWSGPQVLVADYPTQSFPSVISDGAGYMVYWAPSGNVPGDTNRNVYATTSATGTFADFGAPQRLSSDTVPSISNNPRAVTSPFGYAVVWETYANGGVPASAYASTWDGSAWSGEALIEASDESVSVAQVAGGAGGYAVALLRNETLATGSTRSLDVNVHDGSGWGGATPIEALDTRVDYPQRSLVANGPGFGIGWSQAEQDGGHAHARFAIYDGSGWTNQALENRAAGADEVRVSGDADGTYTVFWRQADPDGEATLRLPWAASGIE